ncbi:protein arginine N-methyltransferase 6 [Adelges cooleyi]|uniref:protein arginine N-methyltransferase 6 n=1 Tax=Adelges cooleyi TaxID=133065 RepID=UPI00217FFEDC|nr:protein arginine N-methyltransferase 6 [Adelges cooleyi]
MGDATNGTDSYFLSYEDLEVHKLMIQDSARTEAYRKAILSNRQVFEGKTVLDVGAGTGLLSIFCAQAGASKVYAVEASNTSELARKVIEENHFSDIIDVVNSKVENLTLPYQVNVIVSEWMGFYLLHESMLDSVLYARDTFLRPDGCMFPSHCALYASPCSLPQMYSDFDEVSGVKLRKFAEALRKSYLNRPKVMTISSENILATSAKPIFMLDLLQCQVDTLNEIVAEKCLSVVDKTGIYQGVCFWFDVKFPTDDCTLSTAPTCPETHWKQTIIVLPAQMDVEEGDAVMFNVKLTRNDSNKRYYNISLDMLDAEHETHPTPCSCNYTKCKIIKTFLSVTENISDDDDEEDDEEDECIIVEEKTPEEET